MFLCKKRKFIIIIMLILMIFKQLLKIKILSKPESVPTLEPELNVNISIKINACIFILCQDKDFFFLKKTIKSFDKLYNYKHNYPYVLMNNEEFSIRFKREIVKHTNSLIEFGLIPKEQWQVPSWIDSKELTDRLHSSLRKMQYGTKISYHHMCRYYSGFFFRHNLTLKYDYYIRLDPHLDFPCDWEDDPFKFLINRNKKYGFVITLDESIETIPTLWNTIKEWKTQERIKSRLPITNTLDFISQDNGDSINACHFWNNFEIGSFDNFRNDLYLDYFNYLDKKGGFYYERWGDAPVHTYFILLSLNKSQIHRFSNIGYGHHGIFNWPENSNIKCYSKNRGSRSIYFNEKCTNLWENVK